jgi:tetratricopeptide (TPR) repeat protein
VKHLAIRAGSLAALVAMAMPALACINSASLDIKFFLQKDNRDQALRVVANLEKEYESDKSAEVINDLAVARILFGRVDEAIVLLNDLERQYPGRAATAANLGTAFELSGKNQAALEWIREGIRRDPKEHSGSEWVHVRILEAKLALETDPRWLDNHSILGLSFGDAPLPSDPGVAEDHLGNKHPVANAWQAVAYQLFERTLLVKPEDRVVADLYFTSGNLGFVAIVSLEDANRQRNAAKNVRKAFDGALAYGDPRSELINRRLTELSRRVPDAVAVTKP